MEIELFLTYSLYTKMKRKNVVKFEIINKKKIPSIFCAFSCYHALLFLAFCQNALKHHKYCFGNY